MQWGGAEQGWGEVGGQWEAGARMGPRQGSHVRCTDSVILGPLPGDHASVWSGLVGAARLSSGTALGLESGQGLSSSCCCRKVIPAPQHISPPVQTLHAACSVVWKAQGHVQAHPSCRGLHFPTFTWAQSLAPGACCAGTQVVIPPAEGLCGKRSL